MCISMCTFGSELPKVTADVFGKQTFESEADWEGRLSTPGPLAPTPSLCPVAGGHVHHGKTDFT